MIFENETEEEESLRKEKTHEEEWGDEKGEETEQSPRESLEGKGRSVTSTTTENLSKRYARDKTRQRKVGMQMKDTTRLHGGNPKPSPRLLTRTPPASHHRRPSHTVRPKEYRERHTSN